MCAKKNKTTLILRCSFVCSNQNIKMFPPAHENMDVKLILVTVLMLHLLVWQLLQMLSEPAWGPKAWTRWSVTDLSSWSQANSTLRLLRPPVTKAGAAVCFRSRMRKVTWPLPTTAPPSWSRCRCSTLQPKWYVPTDAAWLCWLFCIQNMNVSLMSSMDDLQFTSLVFN